MSLQFTHSTHNGNPYVGPRPYCPGETLFGRDQEILDLFDLLLAERIVLMYSPSGAGKSSLIEAGLRPKLQEEGFEVFPTLRVSFVPVTLSQHHETSNRYILSLLLSLEESLPKEDRWDIKQLSNLTVEAYLNQRWAGNRGEKLKVLFFDQFEEILTLNPVDQDVKIEFFKQIGQVLRNPEVWVLFSMREEFVPALDPFLYLIPTRLKTRFRLELLTKEAAAEAIQKPAQSQKVLFTDEALEFLTQDLAKIVVQDLDGNKKEKTGNYIEPVQLQVVCSNIWDDFIEKKQVTQITKPDIENSQVSNVDAALGQFYAQTVLTIANNKATEGKIRLWIENHLITDYGTRGQVLQGPQESQGLPNHFIQDLVDRHLIRAERRLGSTWYEISHDRLVQPILKNNENWFPYNSNDLNLLRQLFAWEKKLIISGNVRAEPELEHLIKKTKEYIQHFEKERVSLLPPPENKPDSPVNREVTVVELDLVEYSSISAVLQESLGPEAVLPLNQQIQEFINQALQSVGVSRSDSVMSTTGDGAILLFEEAHIAHQFARTIHNLTQQHNKGKSHRSGFRLFRIGAATGTITLQPLPTGGFDIAGITIAIAVRLESAAKPGEFVVDKATFDILPDQLKTQYGPEELIRGKRDEIFKAFRCIMNPEIEVFLLPSQSPPNQTAKNKKAKIRTCYDLFDKLVPSDQIDRLVALLGIPHQNRPAKGLSLREKTGKLIEYLSQLPNGLDDLEDELRWLISKQRSEE